MNGLNQVNLQNTLTQRTKLVKIQDSMVFPSDEEIEAQVEDRDVIILVFIIILGFYSKIWESTNKSNVSQG